jgi:hypothetical protein
MFFFLPEINVSSAKLPNALEGEGRDNRIRLSKVAGI